MDEPKQKTKDGPPSANVAILNFVLVVGGIVVFAMIAVVATAIVLISNTVSSETKSREQAQQVAYEGRVDLTLAQRKQCRDDKLDRNELIDSYGATIAGSKAIASDPFQSDKTRKARRAEAARLQNAVIRLKLRTGKNLNCKEWAPDPRRPEGVEKDSRL